MSATRPACCNCGDTDVPLRQIYQGRDGAYCQECYVRPDGFAPGTGGLPYPDWDDCPEVERD